MLYLCKKKLLWGYLVGCLVPTALAVPTQLCPVSRALLRRRALQPHLFRGSALSARQPFTAEVLWEGKAFHWDLPRVTSEADQSWERQAGQPRMDPRLLAPSSPAYTN